MVVFVVVVVFVHLTNDIVVAIVVVIFVVFEMVVVVCGALFLVHVVAVDPKTYL